MWTEELQEELILGFYSGEFTLDRLPRILFELTFGAIIPLIEKGFRGGVESIPAFTKRHVIATSFRDNINVFSGAKTFQEAKDLSKLVFLPDGSKRPFKEFAELARAVDSQYNLNWLKVEQDAAFARAQSADKWTEIEEQKDVLPFIRFSTVGDDRVRDEHAVLDGIIKPVDDKFWDTHFPPLEWGCRCDADQLEDGDVTDLDEHLKKYNELAKREGFDQLKEIPMPPKLFANNPGKTHYIFKGEGVGKHPYFKVERKYDVIKNDNNFRFGYL